MELDMRQATAMAGRPADALTRRDVARALLAVPAADAMAALPSLRRQLVSAGNPLSAAFWEGAEAVTQKIADAAATVGDVRTWLEATGTEPLQIIGMLAWDDEDERSPLQSEVHGLLVAHLESLVASGEIDPDLLVAGDPAALRRCRGLQEEWMTTPLPDGRVPMWTVSDEMDEEFLAEWDAAEAEALAELRTVLGELPERPLPAGDLRAVCARVRATIQRSEWPAALLAACGGVDPRSLPADDAEMWLTLASGVVAPREELHGGEPGGGEPGGGEPGQDDGGGGWSGSDGPDGLDELSEDDEAMVAFCALDHYDWLAAVSALARGGPGTTADADHLARYVSEHDPDPDDADDQADAAAGMFLHVVGVWRVLGVVDDDDRLTPLGWWGLPEALQRAWAPQQ